MTVALIVAIAFLAGACWQVGERHRRTMPAYVKRMRAHTMAPSFRRSDSGAVAIEAAFVLPVLLLAVAVGVDAGLATVAKYQLVFGTSQAAAALASGADPQAVFSGNSAGTVTCAANASTATCDGATQYAAIFSGMLGMSSIPMSAHAVAAVQRSASQ